MRARLADRDAVIAAAARIDHLRAEADRLLAEYKAAAAATNHAREAAGTVTERRIGGLRDGLGVLACPTDDRLLVPEHLYARRVLDTDARMAHEAISLPAHVAALHEAEERLQADAQRAADAYRTTYPLAARLDAIRAAEADVAQGETEQATAISAYKSATEAHEEAVKAVARVGDRRSAHAQKEAAAQRRRAELTELARRAPMLDVAEARIAEIEGQLAEARTDLATAAAARAELPPMPALEPIADADQFDAYEREANEADAALSAARTSVALAEDALQRAEMAHARVVTFQSARAAAEEAVADWTFLLQGLRHVQADLADSAGPELAAVANDLLRASVGSRWTLAVKTTREGGKGQPIEGYSLRIFDAEVGREGDASTYSPGERAILGAAVADAVATLAAKRARLREMTLVRDEVDAPLSAEMAAAWVAMTRRTMEMTGAAHCLIVTHNPIVIAACDVALVVKDGAIEILS
jgi:exonuclease SbcC